MSDSKKFVDDGDRSKSKISAEKGTDAPEVEVVDRQMAPKVSVKVERKVNLGDYNSVTAQVFLSSGTLEEYRGDLLNEDGEVKQEIQTELNEVITDLQNLAQNRVTDTLKSEAKKDFDFESRNEVNHK